MPNTRVLAKPSSLANAVGQVIAQNKAARYDPSRFRQMTGNGKAPDLEKVIENIITNADTGLLMAELVQRYDDFLTIEDYVANWGEDWRFLPDVVAQARERVTWFDRVTGRSRYEASA